MFTFEIRFKIYLVIARTGRANTHTHTHRHTHIHTQTHIHRRIHRLDSGEGPVDRVSGLARGLVDAAMEIDATVQVRDQSAFITFPHGVAVPLLTEHGTIWGPAFSPLVWREV